ncbi:MAG: carboxypeptidase-like regulatory domain-containing protein [Runella slithyformis]|nr:MAG: carboxypeptidase-like regulatory domain-containing protein [Runella slithyformis]TAE99185.1 MAG: carboxypeptidase-like regulatory domain-containing protein [Runella slithyformis]TAF29104.1 MAG: carboxypeptidase-like regulatory domain-containing protein [Runella slithyformis]TAF48702.1 MAG: carboxypeptidase-like regulatory domain-containing protein [Runella slithyformis]TAF79735.1 MAG: carboxypeptidase-like regulatory domain-containing protein [Runella slithyformis]
MNHLPLAHFPVLKQFLAIFWVISAFFCQLQAQNYTFTGRVTDAQTGDPVPFASVAIKGKTAGASTNFEGFYTIKTTQTGDSLIVGSLGYRTRSKAIQAGVFAQTIDFQLESAGIKLQEVKIYAGENPAYSIIRKVVKEKDLHNPARLSAYEYDSYNKVEIDVDNLSERFKRRKAIKKIVGAIEKFDKIAGEDGKPVIPIYLSESISKFYYRNNPRKQKEKILKTNVKGIAVTDGNVISQLVGSSFQQYNFYNNWLNIVNKDFMSPIADGWKTTYEYYLVDTTFVGGYWCYRVDFEPKRPQDQAFGGSIWIDTLSHALVQIDATIGQAAQLNFIEKIKIQQEYDQTDNDSTWLTTKSRVMVDVAQVADSAAGMLVKFYTSNRNIVVNRPRPSKFYDTAIELADDSRDFEGDFWDKARYEPLTAGESTAYKLIDSVRQVPVVRTYVEILNIFVGGYKRIPKVNIDVGPYLYTYARNTLEGNRIRLGLRTNPDFSRHWVFSGHLAYGTTDQRYKYSLGVDYIFSRKPWTIAGVSRSYDLERIGLTSESIGTNALFGAFARWGNYRRAYFQGDNSVFFKRELFKGLTQTVGMRQRSFDPMYPFAYRTNPQMAEQSPIRGNYQTTELFFETRWGKDEVFLYSDNERLTLGTQRWPLVMFRYQRGVKHLLDGDFDYHRLALSVQQSVRVGILGRSTYNLSLGYIPSNLPYPLLYTPLGNESFFYVENAYNLMNFFEFACDQYAQVRFEHNFEGLLFNRLPLIKKWKWRFLVNAKALYGSVRQANRDLLASVDVNGEPVLGFNALSNTPYLEMGYAIDNIFKVLRLDAVHRLTYRQNANITPFAVKFSFRFNI